METIIAIPLYMILIGGTFWIGELMLARQKLVMTNRYVAWNRGLRYSDAGTRDIPTVQRLFFIDSETRAPSDHRRVTRADATIDRTYDWSHQASGQVQMLLSMPAWTRALFGAGVALYDSGVPEEQATLTGRTPADRHIVLMRTEAEAKPAYIRNQYGRSQSGTVATRWNAIDGEKWPYE